MVLQGSSTTLVLGELAFASATLEFTIIIVIFRYVQRIDSRYAKHFINSVSLPSIAFRLGPGPSDDRFVLHSILCIVIIRNLTSEAPGWIRWSGLVQGIVLIY